MKTTYVPMADLPSLTFDGKTTTLGGADISKGVVGINTDITANGIPVAVITVHCSSIDIKTGST